MSLSRSRSERFTPTRRSAPTFFSSTPTSKNAADVIRHRRDHLDDPVSVADVGLELVERLFEPGMASYKADKRRPVEVVWVQGQERHVVP